MTNDSKNNLRIVPDSASKRMAGNQCLIKSTVCFEHQLKTINASQIAPEYTYLKCAGKIFA
ncbi:MAG: hypothetical protein Q7U16_08255 [Agitococcus sp.]|nr:hypothetical protein [Agitococcus sp.]